MAVPLSRIQALTKLRCAIYGHSYNPSNTRTGAKVLRARLRGPAIAAYYPPRTFTMADIERLLPPDLETYDDDESDRLDGIALRKARGKGNPKKKRTAEESKKFQKKKPVVAPKKPPTGGTV